MEHALNRWHDAVNSGDPEQTRSVVCDPIVVLGPKGAGPITPDEFADWVARSGIKLAAQTWHPISDRLMMVEQTATWPQDAKPKSVATLFRVTGDKVSAALRLPDLRAALDLAFICREMAATE
ncbi:hypothetical protein [Rhizobium sp. LEGMi135b]